MKRLSTPAWLLRGISSVPGELRLISGKLSFTCSGTGSAWPFQLRKLGRLLGQSSLAQALEEGSPFELFQWPADQVQSAVPWYYFGGGIKLRYQGVQLHFGFGRPSSGSTNIATAAAELSQLSTMRHRGKLWAKALSSAVSGKPGEA